MRIPPTELTAEEDAFRLRVRAYLAETLSEKDRRGLGMFGHYDPEFSRQLAAAGFLGLSLPREYGGHERPAVERFLVTEELLAARAPVAAHWFSERQSGPAILKFGTEAQKERFLPAIARGECYFSIGMSEPDSGSDLASVRTAAERVPGGWVVNGTKVWTTYAHRNHWAAMLCRTGGSDGPKHAGLSQLLVDLSSEGLTISPILTMDGGSEFCEVVLKDVFVPDDLVLGEVGEGWKQVTAELAFERSGPDRWLSPWGLLLGVVDLLGPDIDPAAAETIGRLFARQKILRRMTLGVIRLIDSGGHGATEAAITKDLGTVFEQDVVEAVRSLLNTELDLTVHDRLQSLLALAVLNSPTWTLRGGTTEILRSMIGKSLSAGRSV